MRYRQQDIDMAKKVLALAQAVVDGKTIQHIERGIDGSCLNWVDCDGICWISVRDYRAKPEPIWRPWRKKEAPLVFMVKEDDDVIGPPLVCQRANDGTQFLVCYPTGPKSVSAEQLFETYSRVMEDNTRTKCGMMEIPL